MWIGRIFLGLFWTDTFENPGEGPASKYTFVILITVNKYTYIHTKENLLMKPFLDISE